MDKPGTEAKEKTARAIVFQGKLKPRHWRHGTVSFFLTTNEGTPLFAEKLAFGF